ARASNRATVLRLAPRRAATARRRSRAHSGSDPRRAQTAHFLWRRERRPHRTHNLAFCNRLFRRSDLVNAWSELRDDFRLFRGDRILGCEMLDESLPVCGKTLFARWQSRFGLEDKPNSKAPVRLTGVARN